ncbi:hypothetical protein GDO81_001231 [Engystomops pustulosus]|uniref:Uncharacterized protein n=1 Tax=Engystomops pustulosus TaxID=76066 RepID=A0AAV7DAN1_ENGPU|nr:hypothetical protein GDO81_001231 [Engystomops pustulosus]
MLTDGILVGSSEDFDTTLVKSTKVTSSSTLLSETSLLNSMEVLAAYSNQTTKQHIKTGGPGWISRKSTGYVSFV